MIVGLMVQMAFPVFAAAVLPTSIGAPENFAASNYGGHTVNCILSAPDDLRALINQTDEERGYHMTILAQVDFRTGNGNWHYSPEWDNASTFTKYTLNYYNALTGGEDGRFLGHVGLSFKSMFPDETNVPVPHAYTSWDWYKDHSITLRTRFAIKFENNNIVFSDWSKEYVLSDANKMDYRKIMMLAWSDASEWATPELEKADDMGLIPDSLKGADMKKNITREEFAEVALLMYEKASGILDTRPIEPNPFVDTANPQILKAFQLGIVKGVSATEFKPTDLINREQVAAMLVRTIKLIAPDADYSIEGAPEFSDRNDISDWALNDCLYMAKIGIIKGTDGKFMPRAITDAQKAVGYANTSREQALAMSVRTIEKLDGSK